MRKKDHEFSKLFENLEIKELMTNVKRYERKFSKS